MTKEAAPAHLLQALVVPILVCQAVRLLYFVQKLLPGHGMYCRCRACGLALIDLLVHHAPAAGEETSSNDSLSCFCSLLQTQDGSVEPGAAAYMH